MIEVEANRARTDTQRRARAMVRASCTAGSQQEWNGFQSFTCPPHLDRVARTRLKRRSFVLGMSKKECDERRGRERFRCRLADKCHSLSGCKGRADSSSAFAIVARALFCDADEGKLLFDESGRRREILSSAVEL